ncbi:SMP-30/gluconolactonase/LRE family protein [Nocardia sp. NPDC005366]|uniref:SMP-30/gluconolactonase/LRE family protein n=1 Tax=Nocardia sp. NPDC005366 TaxID=3156878 RepID=UPI0033A50961
MLRQLYSTDGLLEAPLVESDGSVVFSNVTGGGIFRHRGGETDIVVDRRRGVGGLASHAEGGLVMTGRDLAFADGDRQHTLLSIDGATGFNDLTVAADGSVYVGVLRHRPQQGESAVPSEVVRIDPGGIVTVAASDIRWPNGLGFAPDEQTLYVCEYAERRVLAVQQGRTRVFATAPTGECDGLAVDVEGGVWVALGSGSAVARFTPDGTLDTMIDVPDGFVSSVAFDGEVLYITTASRLLSTSVGVRGHAVAMARIPVH